MRLRRGLAAWIALCGAGVALASGPEDWAALHSGRLISSLDRDPAAAVTVYEAVIDHLDENDPLRGDYLYWLGRAWFEAGDSQQAVETLRSVDPRSELGTAARDFRGRLELTRHPVTSLPVTIDAGSSPLPIVPGWGSSAGALEVVQEGTPLVVWPIPADSVRAGFLAVGIAPGAGRLQGVRVDARSTEVVLAVRIVVETWSGSTWVGPPQVLRPGLWTEVTASLDTLRPQRRTDTILDASQVGMVAIELVPVDPGNVSSGARLQLRRVVLSEG